MPPDSPKYLKFFIKGLISFLLISYLAFKINWHSLGGLIHTIRPGYFLMAFVIVLLSTLFLAAKCSLLIQESSINHSFWGLVKINIVSRFYALFLPPAMGPEMVRWYKITKNQPGKIFFIAASLFERAGFILVSLLSGALFLYSSPLSRQIGHLQNKLMPLLLILIMLVLAVHIFFLSEFVHRLGRKILFKLVRKLSIKQRLLDFYDNFFLTNRPIRLLVWITGLSISWHIFFLICSYLLFLTLSIPLGFLDVAWISSLIFLLQLLPVSLAGIGLREGAFAYMFIQIGRPPEQGVAVGLLFFLQFLLLAIVGGLIELFDFIIHNKK